MEMMPLMHSPPLGGPTSPNSAWDSSAIEEGVDHRHNNTSGSWSTSNSSNASKRGVLLTLCASVFIFSSAAAMSRTVFSPEYGWRQAPPSRSEELQGDDEALGSFSLIGPTFGNSSKPTLTSTADCTGDKTRPVLAGADVVEFFSLPDGSKPVIGKGDITAEHNGYLFFFSSQDNQQLFKVRHRPEDKVDKSKVYTKREGAAEIL